MYPVVANALCIGLVGLVLGASRYEVCFKHDTLMILPGLPLFFGLLGLLNGLEVKRLERASLLESFQTVFHAVMVHG